MGKVMGQRQGRKLTACPKCMEKGVLSMSFKPGRPGYVLQIMQCHNPACKMVHRQQVALLTSLDRLERTAPDDGRHTRKERRDFLRPSAVKARQQAEARKARKLARAAATVKAMHQLAGDRGREPAA